jgi:hypothetical protein
MNAEQDEFDEDEIEVNGYKIQLIHVASGLESP